MNHQHTFPSWFGALGCTLLISWSPAFSQSVDRNLVEVVLTESAEQRGQFIAAFEWSVDKSGEYVWPFESIRPAPYESVRMLVEQMPRAWPEKGKTRGSIPLSAYRSLRVNGNWLPKPQRTAGYQEEFRVYLVKGRLRFSFSVPYGFKLDPRNTIIRIKLNRVG